MRTILIMAALLIGAGSLLGGFADKITPQMGLPKATAAAATVPQRARSTIIPGNGHNHFEVSAHIGGQPVGFLVDTGASIVALNQTAASSLGIRTSPRDPVVTLQTANGKVNATRVRLAAINVGGVEVQDVDAVVLPDNALKQNLLGMTYLSRLTRYEFRSGQLVLEQ